VIVVPSIRLPGDGSSDDQAVRSLLSDWSSAGFQRVSIDLPGNLPPADAMRSLETLVADLSTRVDLQVTGPVESRDDIETLLDAGACLVRIGDRALDEAEWLASAASAFPQLLVVATPARERRSRTRGWTRTRPVDVRDLVDELSDLPLGGVQVDFIDEEGLDHSSLDLIEDLAESAAWPIMVGLASPTMAQLRDIEFRGASATIVDGKRVFETSDDQALARAFYDA
jgi:phosphoribosylformimino-5-aminoimidazole carboxamide ribonucleotide (ProFAR) isomerase